MKRHAKANPDVRCCWVCGKEGGAGFTRALDNAGYEVAHGPDGGYAEIGYAHPQCMTRAMRKAAKSVQPGVKLPSGHSSTAKAGA